MGPWLLIQLGDGSATPPPPPVGGVETVLAPYKSGPHGPHFSRKRFDEIQAAYRAAEQAERRALELKTKQAAALRRAAKAVERAAAEAEEREANEQRESTADLERMTRTLQAATNASRATSLLKNAKAAYEQAMAAIEEDEEEAMLLLLH